MRRRSARIASNKTRLPSARGRAADPELCFVAIDQKGRMVALDSKLADPDQRALAGGPARPLAIAPELRGLGYGKALMWHSMAQSRMLEPQPHHLGRRPRVIQPVRLPPRPHLNVQLPRLAEDRRNVPGARLVAGSMIGVHA